MENKSFGLGVFVCVFNRDLSKILLLKRNEEKRKKWGADWGNIGGKIEFGETSFNACLREAKEEINADLDINKLKLIHIKETPDFLENIHALHFVYATILDEDVKLNINSESDSYQWFSLNELPEKMIDKKEYIYHITKLAKEHF